MPQAGDTYEVALKQSHLNWGTYRNPTNRNPIKGEAYIPIPKDFADNHGVYNSNHTPTGYGYNQFHAKSKDGFLHDVTLLAQGSSSAGAVYAKQFSVQDNLKEIGDWYRHCKASVGDKVKVEWVSTTSVVLEII
ncbi:hypothetical protein [Bifidobacterium crudilactis]|uniref:hypothetical protein n=1 Tax=Bifidobacterium crudilactis TaxID=327277 RepID=UPI00264950C6|nr:hypothetical protein [Bifidobacterium crudilactis]MDN5973024.1 hypothetical protein [Bifidobacterium crudilactis]MDN6000984.1 hypothetical protein [Bifidobacterium crudilactis]MDN6209190.1 hypothetical protein [Bifidobacterium crudilactis]MDN6467682.1 hypothetical protein [Bifidobacterium crudilactis]MDN6558382.1 hypothetical protein [Bifidobacterium crudilactis]